MVRAVITGATGLVGSRLVAEVAQPVALSRDPDAARARLGEQVTAYAWSPDAGQHEGCSEAHSSKMVAMINIPKAMLLWSGSLCCAVGCNHNHRAANGSTEVPPTSAPSGQPSATVAATTAATAPTASSTAAANATASHPSKGVQLTFSPSEASFASSIDASVTGTVENNGAESVLLRMDTLASPVLALEIHDAKGERMLTVPPPMPLPPDRLKDYELTLKPGEKKEITYSLHIFSPPLPPGRYTVTLRSAQATATTFSFTITGR